MAKRSYPLSKVYGLLEPGPVVLLTTAHRGRANVMTLSWHTMLEFEPPLVGCVVSGADFSHTALRLTKQCVINIPTVELSAQVVGCGNTSGRRLDKFQAFGLTPVPARRVVAPLIAEVLRLLGSKRALVVHSFDGLDEFSISETTQVYDVTDGTLEEYIITPEMFGLERAARQQIQRDGELGPAPAQRVGPDPDQRQLPPHGHAHVQRLRFLERTHHADASLWRGQAQGQVQRVRRAAHRLEHHGRALGRLETVQGPLNAPLAATPFPLPVSGSSATRTGSSTMFWGMGWTPPSTRRRASAANLVSTRSAGSVLIEPRVTKIFPLSPMKVAPWGMSFCF